MNSSKNNIYINPFKSKTFLDFYNQLRTIISNKFIDFEFDANIFGLNTSLFYDEFGQLCNVRITENMPTELSHTNVSPNIYHQIRSIPHFFYQGTVEIKGKITINKKIFESYFSSLYHIYGRQQREAVISSMRLLMSNKKYFYLMLLKGNYTRLLEFVVDTKQSDEIKKQQLTQCGFTISSSENLHFKVRDLKGIFEFLLALLNNKSTFIYDSLWKLAPGKLDSNKKRKFIDIGFHYELFFSFSYYIYTRFNFLRNNLLEDLDKSFKEILKHESFVRNTNINANNIHVFLQACAGDNNKQGSLGELIADYLYCINGYRLISSRSNLINMLLSNGHGTGIDAVYEKILDHSCNKKKWIIAEIKTNNSQQGVINGVKQGSEIWWMQNLEKAFAPENRQLAHEIIESYKKDDSVVEVRLLRIDLKELQNELKNALHKTDVLFKEYTLDKDGSIRKTIRNFSSKLNPVDLFSNRG